MMRKLPVAVFAVACAAVLTGPAGAATAADRFVAVRTDRPPALVASFDDPVWATAVRGAGLTTVTTKTASRHATRFAILYDAENLYVQVEVVQRSVPIVATQTANNVGFGLDDYVGAGIDTSGNSANAYYFFVTPLGTRYQQANESSRYAPPWRAVTARTEGGWNALLVIPLRALKTPGSAVQNWRFNVVRHVAAANENESWAYDPIMNDGGGGPFPIFADARFWPTLAQLRVETRFRPRLRSELYGLSVAGGDRTRFLGADGSVGPAGLRAAGGDLSYPLAPTISLVGALAPDFSNVETDQQTIAPQEFRRALTEYRPFFAQGAEYFNPLALNGVNTAANTIWYSPSIGAITRGVKLEGTHGLQSFGVLEARGAGFDDTILGYKHRAPNRSFGWSVDGAFTHHAAVNDTVDQRAGNDATLQFEIAGRDDHTGFVYGTEFTSEQGSFVSIPGLARKSEDFVDIHKRNYEVFLNYRDVGPQYAPVDGYTVNNDVRGPQFFLDFNGSPGRFQRVDLFLTGERLLDRSGAVRQADANLNLDITTKSQFHLWGGASTSQLRSYAAGYPFYTGGVTTPYNAHSVNLGYRDGTPSPIDGSYSWGPFGGTYLQQTTFTFTRTLGTRGTIAFEHDGTLERPLVGPASGQWLRRITVGRTIDAGSNVALTLRGINGTGGFATPGVNLSGSYHRRFRNDSELFVNYGTPAAPATLERLIVKVVVRTGGGAGT